MFKPGQWVTFSTKGCLGRIVKVRGPNSVDVRDMCPFHSHASGGWEHNPVWLWNSRDIVHAIE